MTICVKTSFQVILSVKNQAPKQIKRGIMRKAKKIMSAPVTSRNQKSIQMQEYVLQVS
jgi:hypothetical protein